MIALAAVNGPLPKAGVIAVALLAAFVLLGPAPRRRAPATLGALVLAGALLVAEIWHTPRLAAVHRHPLPAAVAAAVILAVLIGLAAVVARRPAVIAPLAVLTLPFRVPIAAGGTTANLLVPLYLVVAVGALSSVLSAWRRPAAPPPGAAGPPGPPSAGAPAASGAPGTAAPPRAAGLIGWAERLLALYVVIYGIQAAYSPDFEKALQNMVFFYVPFALLYRMLRNLPWTPALVRRCLQVTVALAIAFSAIGFYEYATKTILLNSKLVATNQVHTYFTVNSVFFDPDIFGRYLALTMILLAVSLIYGRRRREHGEVTAALAVLWACLVLTLSRSSLGALLVGMAVLAATRWKPSRALVAVAVVVAAGAGAVAASPTTFGLNQGINGASSGRGGLVSGGLSLFASRPVWGYGSGSFSTEYRAHHRQTPSALSDSHTIAVTILAEQGLIGEVVYAAFVLTAIAGLVRGARGDATRSAVAAAFVALVFHTMLYADFLEDPTTWVLLGVGLALAAAPGAGGAGASPYGAPDYRSVAVASLPGLPAGARGT